MRFCLPSGQKLCIDSRPSIISRRRCCLAYHEPHSFIATAAALTTTAVRAPISSRGRDQGSRCRGGYGFGRGLASRVWRGEAACLLQVQCCTFWLLLLTTQISAAASTSCMIVRYQVTVKHDSSHSSCPHTCEVDNLGYLICCPMLLL